VEPENRKIRPALKVTIIFLCIVAGLTFFSRTLYHINMPVVHIAKPVSGSLTKLYTAEGVIMPREMAEVFAPAPLTISEVRIKQGSVVGEGDVLVEFDVSGLERELEDMRAEHDKLLIQRRQIWGDARAMLDIDIETAERHIRDMEERIEAYREVTAPITGMILEMNAKKGMLAGQAEPLVRIPDAAGGFRVNTVMDAKTASFFESGNKVTLNINAKKRVIEGRILSMMPPASGDVDVIVDMQEKLLIGGELVTMEFINTSKIYDFLVPVEALQFGQGYLLKIERIDGILGEETILRKIRISETQQDRDEEFAAVVGDIKISDEIVISSDRELTGGRVRVFQEAG